MDTNNINISVLEQSYSTLQSEKSNFRNTTYSTFKSSYIYNCNDDLVRRLKKNLDSCYDHIEDEYRNITRWFEYYLDDVKRVDHGIVNGLNFINTHENAIQGYYSTHLTPLTLDYDKIHSKVQISTVNFNSFKVSSNGLNSNFFGDISFGKSNTTTMSDKDKKQDIFLEKTMAAFGKLFSIFITGSAASTMGNSIKYIQENDLTDEVMATIGTFFTSIGEGLLKAGEAFVDFSSIYGTSQYLYNTEGLTVEQQLARHEEANQMWENTMAFVEKDHVGTAFNEFYEDDGKWLKDNAYYFDTMRAVGSGVGEVGGIVLLQCAGIPAPVTAGMVGFGKGSETAWQNGASLEEGLLTGAVTATVDGVSYYVGGKINNFSPFKNDVLNSLCRITLDGVDGATNTAVQTGVSLIYQDGYTDSNGEYHAYSNDFFTAYGQAFDAQGGWANVLTGAAFGAFMSSIGEISGIAKHFRDHLEGKINVETDVNLNKNTINNIKNLLIDEYKVKFDGFVSYLDNKKNNVLSGVKDKFDSLSSKFDEIKNAKDVNIKNDTATGKVYANDAIDDASIFAANYATAKGLSKEFRFTDADSMPDRNHPFWRNIQNSDKILINVGGRLMSFDDAMSYKMNYDLNKSSINSESNILDNNIVDNVVDSKPSLLDKFKKEFDFYGGSQESALSKYKKLFKSSSDKIEVQKIENVIRKYYPNATKQEILSFLTRFKEHGCSYVAFASSIFEQLNYDADLFYKKFGFNMYNSDGSLNHDELILDIFSSMSTMIEVNYNKANVVNYKSWVDAYQDIIGLNPATIDNPNNFSLNSLCMMELTDYAKKNNISITTDEYGNVVKKAFDGYKKIIGTPDAILSELLGGKISVTSEQELLKILNSNGISAKIDIGFDASKDGGKIFSTTSGDWINAYFERKGIDLKFDVMNRRNNTLDTQILFNELTDRFNNGYSIEVSALKDSPIHMTDGSNLGWVTLGGGNSGHAMIFRGITENNELIVSSWGKYYKIPEEFIKNLEFNYMKSVSEVNGNLKNIVETNLDNNVLNSASGKKDSLVNQIKNMFTKTSEDSKSAIISSPPEYINAVGSLGNDKRKGWLEKWSEKLNVSEDSILETFNQKLNQFVNDSDFGIRVTDKDLYTILKDGSFRNQFETGTSKGVLDFSARKELEKNMFNVPNSIEISDRPVYGMLFPKSLDDRRTIRYYKDIYNGRSYGDTVVILKKENIIDSTTLTLGDSLTFEHAVSATLASNPEYSGNHGFLFKKINSLAELKNADLYDFADGNKSYPEIQLHGSSTHSIDNIEKIIFLKEPDKKLIKLLNKKGIGWEIIPN